MVDTHQKDIKNLNKGYIMNVQIENVENGWVVTYVITKQRNKEKKSKVFTKHEDMLKFVSQRTDGKLH